MIILERSVTSHLNAMTRFLRHSPQTWKELSSGRSLVPSFDIIVQKVVVSLHKKQGNDFFEGPASPQEPIAQLSHENDAVIDVGFGSKLRYYYVYGGGIDHAIYACDVTQVVDEINGETLGGWKEEVL